MPIVTHEFLDFLKRAPVGTGVCMCGGTIPCGEPHTSVDQWDHSLGKFLAGVAVVPRGVNGKSRPPLPDWTIVEASREEKAALRESWETGEPVEIAGVRFDMAVLARRRGWFSPALVRGVVMG